MILNTKYHDIREVVGKKLEEFFTSLDHLEYNLTEAAANIDNHSKANNEDVHMQQREDFAKQNENAEASGKIHINHIDHIHNNNSDFAAENNINSGSSSKIFLSTSQIMTKILLGKEKNS